MSTSWFGNPKPKNIASNIINTPAWVGGKTEKKLAALARPKTISDFARQEAVTTSNAGNQGGGGGGGGGGSSTPPSPPRYNGATLKEGDLDYNVGMVLPAYHGNRFEALTKQTSDIPNKITGTDLAKQFGNPGQNKGMIATYIPKDSSQIYQNIPQKDGVVNSDVREGRYGFQFHYNPKSLSMTYSGQPNVDLGYIASGEDPFHPAGTATTQSAISVQIPLNRIADFQYYNPETRELKAGTQGIYGPNTPSAVHQQRIYEYGTMYDLEYLLAACLGFKMQTKHREVTSDIGYVSGRPVEIFLGKRLKYLAMVNSVSVGHEIFDQRMVPIFSTLKIDLSIMPDINVW